MSGLTRLDGKVALVTAATSQGLRLVERGGTEYLEVDLGRLEREVEHLRDGTASACGYTPSSWMTFVLQQNPAGLPQNPLVQAQTPITLASGDSLAAAITAMLVQLDTVPDGARENGTSRGTEIESPIDYRYQVLAQTNSVSSLLPVFLVGGLVVDGDEGALGGQIAANLASWQSATGASSQVASFSFRLTVFATTIAVDGDRLPLVQFAGLVIPIPDNNPGWWGSS